MLKEIKQCWRSLTFMIIATIAAGVMLHVILASIRSEKYIGLVEQEYKKDYNNETQLYTFVWYKDEIVEAYVDSVNHKTSEAANQRKLDGYKLIKQLKASE